MQSVTAILRNNVRRLSLAVTLAAIAGLHNPPAHAQASCPWSVQPQTGAESLTRFALSYEGRDPAIRHFYGFSAPQEFVAEGDDADEKLTRIAKDGSPLLPVSVGPNQAVYQVTPRVPADNVVYLVSSDKRIDVLEGLSAHIRPMRAVQVSRAPLFRGGSDRHGPLPEAAEDTQAAALPAQTEFCWFVLAAG